MESKDIPALLDIWLRASLTAHDFIDADYWRSQLPVIEQVYLAVSRTFVWEEKGEPLGFVSILEEDLFLGALFVAPEHQGRGIGQALLTHCKGVYSALSLAVYRENAGAVAFYLKNSFRVVQERESDQPEHMEYLMSWSRG